MSEPRPQAFRPQTFACILGCPVGPLGKRASEPVVDLGEPTRVSKAWNMGSTGVLTDMW